MIEIHNNGASLLRSNYWDSELAQQGKLFVSVNAGAIRILLPPMLHESLNDMRAGRECVLSRGPWPEMRLADAVEILFDDGSSSPFALHLSPESFDLLPAGPSAGKEWTISVWTKEGGKPHKALERICHWRKVPKIPWLKPWGERGVPINV